MTPDYIAVRDDWTVGQVFDYIRQHGKDSETLLVLYVVDGRGTLIDDIRIRKFLLAAPDAKVADLMDASLVALNAFDEQEKAIEVFREYDREALPVVDSNGVLIGVVTIDDVLDVAEEEATEDIQKIGGVEALDEPYIDTPIPRLVKKRAGWLVVLFLGEMLTTTAMAFFEDELARAIVLVTFIPLIVSSGGNSGSQASTLVIRAMALGEISLRDWWRVMKREILSGLALGLILGAIGFLRVELWSTFSDIYGAHATLIGITIGCTLVGIVMLGTLTGSMLPLILRKLGLDPATSSAPFVATLVDVSGLIIYFAVATLILTGTLL
jgi:magnesium transporter